MGDTGEKSANSDSELFVWLPDLALTRDSRARRSGPQPGRMKNPPAARDRRGKIFENSYKKKIFANFY
jgi:hypothetical protein